MLLLILYPLFIAAYNDLGGGWSLCQWLGGAAEGEVNRIIFKSKEAQAEQDSRARSTTVVETAARESMFCQPWLLGWVSVAFVNDC